ncbi:MAG: pyridoxamine 5'-phosphate oxidase family protein [Acidimicrobiia bacterium]
MSDEPTVDLPRLPPGYIPEPSMVYLSWAEVEDRLREALHYWVSTTRPNGNPHVVPRWGVWLDGSFWYDGSPETRHALNLSENPHCVLHLESGETVTIVEGRSLASDPVTGQLGDRLSAEYARKYAPVYTPSPDSWGGKAAGGLRVLRPLKVIAWTSFPTGVTRFTFPNIDRR